MWTYSKYWSQGGALIGGKGLPPRLMEGVLIKKITDSASVKALKFVHWMAIETGFLCIPTTLVIEGGGAHVCLILRPREWELIWGRIVGAHSRE